MISNTSMHKRRDSGLTLMEILVVLAIVAAVVTLGVPHLVSTGTQVRNTMRTLSIVSRQLHHLAMLNRKTYRLAFQLGEGEEQSYWVESSDKDVKLLTEDQEKEISDKFRGKEEQPKSPFTLDTTVLKKPQTLPPKITFEDVQLGTRNAVITSGRAYIHFLPQGFVEEGAIHITDKKDMHWSLLIHPLTGQGDVIGKYISIKDLHKK